MVLLESRNYLMTVALSRVLTVVLIGKLRSVEQNELDKGSCSLISLNFGSIISYFCKSATFTVFDKLIWHTIGPKSFLFGTAQFFLWARWHS